MSKTNKNKTKEDVRDALAALASAKKKPTIDNIREMMGGGSDSTIVKYKGQLEEEARLAELEADPCEPPGATKIQAAQLLEPLVKCVFLAGFARGQEMVAPLKNDKITLELDRDALILEKAELAEKLQDSQNSVEAVRGAWHAAVEQERLRVDGARVQLDAMRLELLESQKQHAHHISRLEAELQAAKSEIVDRDIKLARLNGRLEASTNIVNDGPEAAAAWEPIPPAQNGGHRQSSAR